MIYKNKMYTYPYYRSYYPTYILIRRAEGPCEFDSCPLQYVLTRQGENACEFGSEWCPPEFRPYFNAWRTTSTPTSSTEASTKKVIAEIHKDFSLYTKNTKLSAKKKGAKQSTARSRYTHQKELDGQNKRAINREFENNPLSANTSNRNILDLINYKEPIKTNSEDEIYNRQKSNATSVNIPQNNTFFYNYTNGITGNQTHRLNNYQQNSRYSTLTGLGSYYIVVIILILIGLKLSSWKAFPGQRLQKNTKVNKKHNSDIENIQMQDLNVVSEQEDFLKGTDFKDLPSKLAVTNGLNITAIERESNVTKPLLKETKPNLMVIDVEIHNPPSSINR